MDPGGVMTGEAGAGATRPGEARAVAGPGEPGGVLGPPDSSSNNF